MFYEVLESNIHCFPRFSLSLKQAFRGTARFFFDQVEKILKENLAVEFYREIPEFLKILREIFLVL
jgi:hypothetical protein